MARLVGDRYCAYDGVHGWDLVTGAVVRLDEDEETARDMDPPGALASLVEVLDHGREGAPRWIALEAGARPAHLVRAAAVAGRQRGYVPIGVEQYVRVRELLSDALADRTLLLIASPGAPLPLARRVLLDAAARSPRPHVMLSVRGVSRSAGPPPRRNDLWLVREARAVYGARPLALRVPAGAADDVARQLLRAERAAEFARAGRHAAAERLLRDVAAALARRRSFAPAARTSIALGRLLLERGRAADADAAFGGAATHAEAAGDEALGCLARVWQAAARTDAGQLTAAEALAHAALLCGTLAPDQRAQAGATLARVLLWQERADDAMRLDLALPDPDADSYAFAAATTVRVLIGAGRIFEAGQAARDLLAAAARPGRDPADIVLAHTAHLRVLLAAGDLALGAACLAEVHAAARRARTPLRFVRARLLWHDALARAGRAHDARDELARLQRLRHVLPPLLRGAIDRRGDQRRPVRVPEASARPALPAAAARLVTAAQEEESDGCAVRRVLELTAGGLEASRMELCSADAGPVTVIASHGAGASTRLGARVLESGIAIGPEPGDPAHEIGVPIRLGSRLLGAIVARWPADRTPSPEAGALLALAAAAAAPRVEGMLSRAREAARASTLLPELVGTSAAITDVRRALARAANAPFAVLVEGESGVGKELAARAIHQLSARRERRFCDVNCAALPDELLESELFGHARGAFTGAIADRPGLIEEADGGTLFLDEVADLSPRAQAKLLRVIQQQEVRRVGETFSRPVDIRIVSAANRDMRAEVAERRFRPDLLYRLDVIRIRMPPLRERPEDVAILAAHFWRAAAARVGTRATLGHGVLAALTRYNWPGNVRELQNVISALAVAAPARGQVRAALLPAAISGAAQVTPGRLADARAAFERRFVEAALARAHGSRTQAARELGLSRQGLLKLLERHGLVSASQSGAPDGDGPT